MLQGWHTLHRSEEGLFQIPIDSLAIKHIEDTWPNKFKDQLHNLKLSIAIDGVNWPYSQTEITYIVWTVLVINNNTPPWLSIKNEHIMSDIIGPGQRQMKNMDVYLQPLIKESKELWEGLHAYDVSTPIPSERSFTLYGICAYTTHDYLRLGV